MVLPVFANPGVASVDPSEAQPRGTGERVMDVFKDAQGMASDAMVPAIPMGRAAYKMATAEPDKSVHDPNDTSEAGARWMPEVGGGDLGDKNIEQARDRANAGISYVKDFDDFPQAKAPNVKYMGGHQPAPIGGWENIQRFKQAQADLEGATTEEGKWMARQADEEAGLRGKNIAREELAIIQEMEQRKKEHAEGVRRLEMLQKQSDEIAKTKIDKGNIFHSPAGVIGAIAATFMPLFTRDPESGTRLINQAIERDIQVQVMNLQNKKDSYQANRGLYADYMNLVKDDQIARALTEAKMKDIASQKILETAARYKAPEIMAQKQKEAALLRRDGIITTMDIFAKIWRDPKLMDQAMRAFWGNSFDKSALGGQRGDADLTADMAEGEPVTITDASKPDERGDKTTTIYQSDVDYIKSGEATEEAPRTMGVGQAKNTFQSPTGEIMQLAETGTEVDAPEAPAKRAGTGVRIDSNAEREAKASGADVVIDAYGKLTGSSKWEEQIGDPKLYQQMRQYKMSQIKAYYIAEGGKNWGTRNMDEKKLHVAQKKWLENDVRSAEEGMGQINKEQKDIAQLTTIVSDIEKHMATIEAVARQNGESGERLISKINLADPNWRMKYKQVKLQLKLGDRESQALDEATQTLYRKFEMLKGPYGNEIYHNMPDGEHKRFNQWMSSDFTFKQMREAVGDVSQSVNSKQQAVSGVGKNYLATLLWQAQHNKNYGAIGFKGIPAHDNTKLSSFKADPGTGSNRPQIKNTSQKSYSAPLTVIDDGPDMTLPVTEIK